MPEPTFPNFLVSKPTPGGFIVPGMSFGRAPAAPTYTPEQADALTAKFAEEHPFAPPGSFTPNVAPTQPDGPEKSDSSEIDYRSTGQQQALALAASLGAGNLAAPASSSSRRSTQTGPQLNPLLTTALNLAAAQESGAERDTINQLGRAGVLPSPADTPGIRSNKLGYLTSRLAAEYAHTQGGPAVRAPGTPIYTGNLSAGSPGTATLSDGSAPPTQPQFDLTQQPGVGSANPNTSVVDNLVRQAHEQMAKSNQPQYFTDPVTGQRFMQYGKTIMRDSAEGSGFPRTVSAAGKTLTEVAPGKFLDEAGNPVSWSAKGNKSAQPKVYHTQVGDFDKDGNPVGAADNAGTTASTQQAAPKAKAFYNHDTVLEEMKRRGINR